ncbi:hypothetical protein JCM11251_004829 [Rhodosporidiobolus azoricus]
MESLGIGRKTPGSGRKVSHSEYVRAIAAADTPFRDTVNTALNDAVPSPSKYGGITSDRMVPPTSAQTPARRRRSRADRTPAQVQAVLTERKRRSSAGLLKPAKELTPGGLLRALSRLPDLPPPTPEEADNDTSSQTLAASTSSRRDSYHPRRSSLLANGSAHPSSSHEHLFSPQPIVTTEKEHASPRSTPSSVKVADTLLASQRLSRSFSRRSSVLSPATSAGYRARRSSIASVASVEAGRRASVVPEDLSKYLVRRRRMTDLMSEKGGEDSMMLDANGADLSQYSTGPEGRFSMGSELARDESFAQLDLGSPGNASASGSRLSLTSALGNLSAARLSLPISLAGADEDEVKSPKGTADVNINGAEAVVEDFPQDDFGGGFDREQSDGEEVEPSDKYDALPTPPALAQIALNRKKRLLGSTSSRAKRPKKQRYTRAGEPIPDLPRSRQKALFQHFLGPNVRMEETAIEALMDASQDFFAALMEDASASAVRAGRNSTINENDIIRAMQDQHLLTSKVPLSALSRQLGVDRELQSVIDGLKLGVSRGRKPAKGKKEALEDVQEEDEEPTEAEGEVEEEEEPAPPPKKAKKRVAKARPAPPLLKTKLKRPRTSTTLDKGGNKEEKRTMTRRANPVRKEEGPLDDSSADEAVFSD